MMQGAFLMQFLNKRKVKRVTTLKVTLNDQTLIAAEKVKVASGDIESVFLEAEFDEAWNDFPVKTASFYTSNDSKPEEILMIDNQCTVPSRLLAEPASLYVGIIGASTDGTKIKTSALVSFKIYQGAKHAYTTLTPDLNLYQQFLNAVKENHDPVMTAIKADIDAEVDRLHEETEQLQQDYEEAEANVNGLIGGTVIWTDTKAATTFAPQTISADLSAYSRFVIKFLNDSADAEGGFVEGVFHEKATRYLQHTTRIVNGYGETAYRSLRINNSGVQFFDAYTMPNHIVENMLLIPKKIIAYKY